MSQKDIDDVLTTIATSLSSPILGGYAQPIEMPQLSPYVSCSCYGQKGYITFECAILKPPTSTSATNATSTMSIAPLATSPATSSYATSSYAAS